MSSKSNQTGKFRLLNNSSKVCLHLWIFNTEAEKLQQRLSLLREEYVKLQKHCEAIEKDRSQLLATSGAQNDSNSFVANILKAIASMFKNPEYR